ncbi:30S ribosomal protein S2 [Porphyromonas endodontalis]|jgi:ribosomal protein S2|uniref:Small ribosomal subunit protein uS2 n=1 Tax=Porphyromonas endodontalis (strain ATCC 35406 / DSM 24491 / JCM 8526 / CCUG 16442 / BCRC 14492 / NCTC 13058 / HG 370) TaxID=553175 RepID=C3JBS1_POREA|nr:30S ribosomal protein S2 [Porphyromonas endodontalis]EEN82447.1 ribosomal protein S2 [Porphyromonas endodontalis ATCC 35406]UBH64182.1 30S ribosomal protein S2 [Porphyromonas endodontalis]SUB67544.1 Vegetative protein 209 [Porphyromonas endodontalis]
MASITFEQLLKAGAHFGHQPRKWNPAMAPYIFMERNNTHIIDLHKTVAKIEESTEIIRNMARNGKKILFVATKKQVKEPVEELAKSVGMPYVVERWPGGMLTNFPTIRKAVKKMVQIDKMKEDGTYSNLSKREKLQVERQRAKLEKTLGSIQDMNRLPSALFVVDIIKEHIAVREATRLGIPVFAIVDTNADPKLVDYVIPANDDSRETVELIMGAMCSAISEGLTEYKSQNVEEEVKDEAAVEGARSGRRTRAGARRERSKETSKEAPEATSAETEAPSVEAEAPAAE